MDKNIILLIMKRYFSRPSSTYVDFNDSIGIRWDKNLPIINRNQAVKILNNDNLIYSLYEEIVRREENRIN
jgi:hypothetical protein